MARLPRSRRRLAPALLPPHALLESHVSIEALHLEIDGDQFAVLHWPLSGAWLPPVLTPAEREVALLAVAGHSNREIAVLRGTSERTVANQIAAVLSKTHASSRAGLIALAAGGRRGGQAA